MKMIQLAKGLKIPSTKGSWRVSDDPQEHKLWVAKGFNIGLLTGEVNGIMVVDFDDEVAGKLFMELHPEVISIVVRTRKGYHDYFLGSEPTRKFSDGDIKGNGGYVVCPPSIVDGFQYRRMTDASWKELKPFPAELFPDEKATAMPMIAMTTSNTAAEIRNVRRYIRGIRSVQGQHGSDACFRVACILRDEGFSEVEALAELVEWNQVAAEPPWEVKDLLKKVRDVFAKTMKGA